MYNSYCTADDRWFYLVGVDAKRQLPKVLAAIDRKDLGDDERFAGARALTKNRGDVIAILDAAFAAQPLGHWATVFDAHDVFWAPIQTPAEVREDPQARATGAWVEVAGAGVESVDAPIRWDGEVRATVAPPPRAGQHTAEVLGEAGLTDAEIAELT